MDEYIYNISVCVDMIGSREGNIKSNYFMKVSKYIIKSETKDNFILLGETHRVKKSNYEEIIESMLYNSSRHIRFIIWTKDKDNIRYFKDKLIQKITDVINTYKSELQVLENTMIMKEIDVEFRDNTSNDYKTYKGKDAKDMILNMEI